MDQAFFFVLYTHAALNAANNAITGIRKVRFESKSSSRKRKVKDEVSFLFNKGKPKELFGNIDSCVLRIEINIKS